MEVSLKCIRVIKTDRYRVTKVLGDTDYVDIKMRIVFSI